MSRLVSDQRESTQALRGEIAVAEERLRNATSRRERAEEERREGDAIAGRVSGELERASTELAQLSAALQAADEALGAHAKREEEVRAALSTARFNLEQSERTLREQREELHRTDLDHQSAERERDELAAKREALETETDGTSSTRPRPHAGTWLPLRTRRRSPRPESPRRPVPPTTPEKRSTRRVSARVRHVPSFLRADELHTSLTAKLNALEGLERERVGLAPAAARLLKERGIFGEGAILGPLSDS